MTNDDLLTRELEALATDAPAGLLDRVAARWVRVPGPVGDLYVASTDQGIAYVQMDEAAFAASFRKRFGRPLLPASRTPAGLATALRTGRATDLRFDLRGSTEFEQAVLRAALTIPRGQVRPYSWIARRIGHPRAVRAVGSALGRNPVPVLIPCHRVTRADGTTGDYVFGSSVKESLLRAEEVDLDEVRALARAGVHYIGSDTTGIVCFPTCPHGRRITAAHRHGFRSMEEAKAAGYRPCRYCRPAAEAAEAAEPTAPTGRTAATGSRPATDSAGGLS
jgi:O-6-methylguanine DNA methyltransferase